MMGRILIAYMIGSLTTAILIKDAEVETNGSPEMMKVVISMLWPLATIAEINKIRENIVDKSE